MANESRPVLTALDRNLGDEEGLKNGATSNIIPVSVNTGTTSTTTSVSSVKQQETMSATVIRSAKNGMKFEIVYSGFAIPKTAQE